MKSTFFKAAMASVIAVSTLVTATSCVDEKYDLSEDRIDLTVTVFQEGISLPLGSTEQIKLESLYSQLDEQTRQMLKAMEGAYMFHMSDSMDMTEDIAGALSDIGGLEGIPISEEFSFSMARIDLSFLDIEPQVIDPEPFDVMDMVNVPDINKYLPVIDEGMSFEAEIPSVSAKDVTLDMSMLGDLSEKTTVAELDEVLEVSDEIAASPLGSQVMDYDNIRSMFATYGINLPSMTTSFVFEPYDHEVTFDGITLPDQIASVEAIKLHPDASFILSFEIINPLFTGGSVSPMLDVDLHEMFHMDKILVGGEDGETHIDGDYWHQHVVDKFVLGPENNWKASHEYHIDALMIDSEDWKTDAEGRLFLDKTFHVKMGGSLQENGLVTTLKHLHDYGHEPMEIKMDVKFNNMAIDDIEMKMKPISVEKDIETSLDITPISLPELVTSVDFVDFDDAKPLKISMNAVVPEVCESMDIDLKSLRLEFPEGVVLKRPAGSKGSYDEKTRVLTYENVSLADGLDDQVIIDRMTFSAPVDGQLSYNGKVRVYAKAQAEGLLSSKKLLASTGQNISVDVSVDYAPEVVDYGATINDYTYPVEADIPPIDVPVSKDMGEFLKDTPVFVSLKQEVPDQNQKIVIEMDYPQHDIFSIIPDRTTGLKIDFPDMIRFSQASLAGYNYDPEENSIHFKDGMSIPPKIELEIEGADVKISTVTSPDGTVSYAIKDEFTVTGGLCLVGTQITKLDIDELKKTGAVVRVYASIPRLAPAQFGMDEYVVAIDEKIEVDKIEAELPDMVESLKVDEILLKDVYLDLEVDAASIRNIVGNVDMNLSLEVVLPEMLLIESSSEGVTVNKNVLKVSESLGKDGKLLIDGIKVVGLDLSDITLDEGKLSLDLKEIPVAGSVKLSNLQIDIDNLKGQDIKVAIAGALATRDDKGQSTGTIDIDKINGHVGLSIDPVNTSIDLSSLSETLNGDNMDLTIDINAYWLTLDVNTNLDIPVKGSLDIIPWYGNQPGAKETREIEMDPATRKDDMYRFFISNVNPSSPDAGSRYEVYKNHTYIPLDLISLLYKKEEGQKPVVVDSIQVSLNAGVDSEKTCTIEPSKDYKFKVDYSLGVPLEFGNDFAFEYRDTIAELPDVAAQIFAYGSVGLGGKVTNSFPLNLDLQVRPLDSNNQVIPLKEEVGHLRIASCDADGNPVTSDLDFVLSGKGADLSDIKAVELIFRADSKDAAGVPLSPDSFIQVQLSARIPDGITLDLGELMAEEEGSQNEQ